MGIVGSGLGKPTPRTRARARMEEEAEAVLTGSEAADDEPFIPVC